MTLSYDSYGRLTQVQEASGKVLSFGYASGCSGGKFGDEFLGGGSVDTKVRTVTDPRGKFWQFSYDAYDRADRLQFYVEPDGSVVAYEWDGNGNMVARVEGGESTDAV